MQLNPDELSSFQRDVEQWLESENDHLNPPRIMNSSNTPGTFDIRDIRRKITTILYLFNLSSQRSYAGDPFQFFYYFSQVLHESISLHSLVQHAADWENPSNALKMLDNDMERKYIENLFPGIGSEDSNKNKGDYIGWIIELLGEIEDFAGSSALPLDIERIERYLVAIYLRDYLRNFREVNGIHGVYRSPDPSRFMEEEKLLEKFLQENEIKHVIDLRGMDEAEKSTPKSYKAFLSRLGIKRTVVNLSRREDGKSIPPGYSHRADQLRDEVGKVFNIYLDTPGSILFHCASGKDRTGIMGALFQELAGYPEEYIVKEYSDSGQDTRPARIKELLSFVKQNGGIEEYLNSIGITPIKQEGIRKKMRGT
ncbi:MAG: tyrosine-protein phosphatase [Promethearchaeota archaeon]